MAALKADMIIAAMTKAGIPIIPKALKVLKRAGVCKPPIKGDEQPPRKKKSKASSGMMMRAGVNVCCRPDLDRLAPIWPLPTSRAAAPMRRMMAFSFGKVPNHLAPPYTALVINGSRPSPKRRFDVGTDRYRKLRRELRDEPVIAHAQDDMATHRCVGIPAASLVTMNGKGTLE